jgi:hypothetical protein
LKAVEDDWVEVSPSSPERVEEGWVEVSSPKAEDED